MSRTVTFLPLVVAEQLEVSCNIISVREPPPSTEEPAWRVDHKRIQALAFDDIEGYVGPEYRNFDYIDALKILTFVEQCGDENIVVHCHAGISRSAAIAKFLADKLDYELIYHPLGSDSTSRHNREVYRTLEIAHIDRVLMKERQ